MEGLNGWARIRERRNGTAIWSVGILGRLIATGEAASVAEARRTVREWRRKLREEAGDEAACH